MTWLRNISRDTESLLSIVFWKGRINIAEIIKVYKEHLPAVRFIGKRYTNTDGDKDGGFGYKWEEWFERFNIG